MIKLYNADCFDIMPMIADKSVDAIITDPPYGTTACKWDSIIPFEPMWEHLNRIIKPNGAIVLFGSEPFSSALRMSNIKNYKYDWIWHKERLTNPLNIKFQPAKTYEIISIFNKHNFYPIMDKRDEKNKRNNKPRLNNSNITNTSLFCEHSKGNNDEKYPDAIRNFISVRNGKHPTQKPVPLIEYLIKTYTLENETVLDFTIGSGTTAVACINTGRNVIGIEKEKKYYDIAVKRIQDAGGNVIQQRLSAIETDR